MGTEDTTRREADQPMRTTEPQSGTREPHPLDLWFKRQRAAWWKKWRGSLTTLLVLAVLQMLVPMALSISLLTTAGSAWFNNSPTSLWTFYSFISFAFYLVLLVTLNAAIAAYGASVATVPEELELALPPGESTIAACREFRRLAFRISLVFLIVPGISVLVMASGFALYSHSASFQGLSIQPSPLRNYLTTASIIGHFLRPIPVVITYMALIELHVVLYLRFKEQFRWEQLILPLAPVAVLIASRYGLAAIAALLHTPGRATSFFLFPLQHLVLALVALAMFLPLRHVVANTLRRIAAREP